MTKTYLPCWLKRASLAFLFPVTAGFLLSQDASPENGMSAFGKMVPAGFANRHVVIPSFDSSGRKSSEVKAETLTRIDDDRLRAEKISIDIFAEEPAKNIRVDLLSAIHHMADHILRSGERSVVRRSDFETSGDSLVFDAATSIGAMKGHVRTLIFDTGTLSGKSESAAPPKN